MAEVKIMVLITFAVYFIAPSNEQEYVINLNVNAEDMQRNFVQNLGLSKFDPILFSLKKKSIKYEPFTHDTNLDRKFYTRNKNGDSFKVKYKAIKDKLLELVDFTSKYQPNDEIREIMKVKKQLLDETTKVRATLSIEPEPRFNYPKEIMCEVVYNQTFVFIDLSINNRVKSEEPVDNKDNPKINITKEGVFKTKGVTKPQIMPNIEKFKETFKPINIVQTINFKGDNNTNKIREEELKQREKELEQREEELKQREKELEQIKEELKKIQEEFEQKEKEFFEDLNNRTCTVYVKSEDNYLVALEPRLN